MATKIMTYGADGVPTCTKDICEIITDEGCGGGGGETPVYCDQDWMLYKTAIGGKADRKKKVKQDPLVDKATTAAFYDAAGIQKTKLIGTIAFTEADLTALGMRASDTHVHVRSIAKMGFDVSNASTLNDRTEGLTRVTFKDNPFDRTVWASATAWAMAGQYSNGKELGFDTITMPLMAGRGISAEVRGRLWKGGVAVPNNSMDLAATEPSRFEGIVEVLGFYHDAGTGAHNNGCVADNA